MWLSWLKAPFFFDIFSKQNKWTELQVNSGTLCMREPLPLEPSETFTSPKLDTTSTNLLTIEKPGVMGGYKTKTAEFKGPKLRPEKCFCHWPSTAAQLAVSFCRPASVMDGRRWTSEGNILTSLCVCVCVYVHMHPTITHTHTKKMLVPTPLGCLSARALTNECVGTLRSSGGRMPFPHPSPPIISRPDKTPVCWRSQDQTVMSRQLSSQHTADARWLSLSWVLGYMQYASGGQLIKKKAIVMWYDDTLAITIIGDGVLGIGCKLYFEILRRICKCLGGFRQRRVSLKVPLR